MSLLCHRRVACRAAVGVILACAALAGCAGAPDTGAASLHAAPPVQTTGTLPARIRNDRPSDALDADTVIALAIAEHEMRRP